MKFYYLKHKEKDGLYGVIQNDQICVQHKPELFWENENLEVLAKYVDPLIPEPFKDFKLIEIEL